MVPSASPETSFIILPRAEQRNHAAVRVVQSEQSKHERETARAEMRKQKCGSPGKRWDCRHPRRYRGQSELLFVGRFAGDDGQILAVAPVFPRAVVHFRVVTQHFCGEINNRGALADVAVTHHRVSLFQACGAK